MLTRRQFFLASAAAASLRAQTGDLPDMLLHYFAQRIERARPASPPTPESVRRSLREITGPYPPRTPLNPRVAKTQTRPGYRIENVLFQSRPDFWVTSNVYVPDGAGKHPAIVMPRGHFDPDRMMGDYQQIAFDLVQAGFVVLSYDPIGQGPRRQQWTDPDAKFDGLFSTSLEHALIGNKLALLGESAAGWQIWDAMSAVDYLVSRPDVDPARIGCADHSDNAAESALFCAVDTRVACAALHAARFGRRWPVDPTTWITLDDTEEYLPGAATLGIDVFDTFRAVAPRPLLILKENLDGGFDSAIDNLRSTFAANGAGPKFYVRSSDASETWPVRLRVDTVAWFARWFQTSPSPKTETDVIPAIGLREICPGRSVHALIRDRVTALQSRPLSRQRLADIIRPLAGKREAPIVLHSEESGDLRIDHLQIPSEPGIRLPARLLTPPKPNGRIIVYVAGNVTLLDPVTTGDDEIDLPPPDRTPQKLAAKGYSVLDVDVRGLGLMSPRIPRRGFRVPYHHLMNRDMALNMMAWSLGDSLLAMRVRDVLRALDHAATLGEVWLAGKDMGAPWALFAAALDDRVRHVLTDAGQLSWRSLGENDRFHQPSSQIHWGILRDLDIPQVAALLAPRRLTIANPSDHNRKPVSLEAAKSAWTSVGSAYERGGDPATLRFVLGPDLADFV